MNALFLYLTRMSIRACVFIPIIIFIRFIIKNQPKFYSYLLWLGVFICLVADMKMFRVNFVTPVSAVQSELLYRYEEVLDDYVGESEIHHHNTLEYYEAINRGVKPIFDLESKAQYVVTRKNTVKPATTVLNLLPIYAKIWFAVVVVLCMLVLKSSIEIYGKIKNAIHYEQNIYLTKDIPSPFVFGIFNPKIYIPESLGLKDLSYIIAHEQCHIDRRDYLLKPMWLFITILHWFNPLVWVAYRMFCLDMEMSCDEKVIESLGGSSKKPYSTLLLDFATDTSLNAAVLFGESKAESRIKNVLNFKKPTTVITVLLGVVAFAAMVLPIISNPVKLMSPITEAPETFYEQLDRVNDIDHLQYKYRMGAEGSRLDPHAIVTYMGDGNLYTPIVDHNRDNTPKLLPDKNYTYLDCLGVRIDDSGTAAYSMLTYENLNNIVVHDYSETYGWQSTGNIRLEGYEVMRVGGHEKIADNYYITTLYGRTAGYSYLLTIHTVDGAQTVNAFDIETFADGVLRSQPYPAIRTVRFLNEKVGIASTTKFDSPELYPHAFITIDGGVTWQELDFSRLLPQDVRLGSASRGCIVNIYGETIEIRYHADKTALYPIDDNYAVISLDGGLTWAGYERKPTFNRKDTSGFEYIKKTDTIPVMLKEQTEIELRNEIVYDVIESYMYGTVENNDAFPPMPEDFMFSTVLSLQGYEENADGSHTAYIVSRHKKYRMNITVKGYKVTGVEFKLAQVSDIPGRKMDSEYDKAVSDIISQYRTDTVKIQGHITEMPAAFTFPQSIPPLFYTQDEMGYWHTNIYSRDNKYMMSISIDNTSYGNIDGTVTTTTPTVYGVSFHQVGSYN